MVHVLRKTPSGRVKYRKTNRKGTATKGAFKKGGPKIGGRKVGTPNKVTVDLKMAILNALDKVGGESWFEGLARRNPKSFTALVGKLLPHQVTGANGNPLAIEMVNKAQAGLSNLNDKELEALQSILAKIGLTAEGESRGPG